MRRVRPFPFDRLDRVARAQVEAARVLLAHLPLAPTVTPAFPEVEALLGGPIALRLVDAYAFPVRELLFRLPGPPLPALARIGAGVERSALLSIAPSLANRLARRVLGLDGDGPEPGPLSPSEQRALGALLAPLLARVSARLEGFVQDDAEITPLFPDPLVLCLDAQVATPAGDGWVRLLAPERLRLRPPAPRSLEELLARRGRLEATRVSLAVEVGHALVPGAALVGLEAGDVIVCDRFGPRPPLGGPVTLRLGHGALLAHLDGEGITVRKGFELAHGGTTMDPKDDEVARAGSDALLRELPVEVVCELGRVTMSGRELLELRPGAVLPVGRPLAGPIDLSVGGRVIARGELVDVEGEVGVRLLQLLD